MSYEDTISEAIQTHCFSCEHGIDDVVLDIVTGCKLARCECPLDRYKRAFREQVVLGGKCPDGRFDFSEVSPFVERHPSPA